MTHPLPSRLPVEVPAHLRGGAHRNLVAPATVTFVLRAPFKPFVSLVGDFNDWNIRANGMVTDGSGTWWTTVDDPSPTRYGFYVAVDNQSHVWVGDPYAQEVRWDASGSWGYLPPRPGHYPWTDDGWRTPPVRDLVLYELCVRDFVGRWEGDYPRYGTLAELADRVDYLAGLGVNAVELMPIQEFPGESSWGYNPVFYFAIERAYGLPADLKRLVNTCHSRGMAVVLDLVCNHTWGDHPYYQCYPPMYDQRGVPLADWNPFFHHTPREVNMWGGVDWDPFHPETSHYCQDVVRVWLEEYHIDGFRFDWVAGVDYDSQNPTSPHLNPFHGVTALCWAARQIKPDTILVGEYWPLPGAHPDKTTARVVAESGLDACWNGLFHHTLEEVLSQRWQWEQRDIFRAIAGFREQGFAHAAQVINYTCSHDEVRPEHEIKFYANPHIGRPPGMSINRLALAKGLLGLVTLVGAPGTPMLYSGQEYGEDTPRTIDFLPLRWDKLDRPEHRHFLQAVKRLIAARRRYAALRSDRIEFYVDDFPTAQLVRFKRWDDGRDYVNVALNFSHRRQRTWLEFPRDGLWRDVVSNRVYPVYDRRLAFLLAPWQGRLFVPAAP